MRGCQLRAALEASGGQNNSLSLDLVVDGVRTVHGAATDDGTDNAGSAHVRLFLDQLDDGSVGKNIRLRVAVPDALLVVLVEVRDFDWEANAC